tara:strand:- start:175 stop:441 length:267 start_codon:yes stop_codon:yes gene_type:complete
MSKTGTTGPRYSYFSKEFSLMEYRQLRGNRELRYSILWYPYTLPFIPYCSKTVNGLFMSWLFADANIETSSINNKGLAREGQALGNFG